MLQTFSYHQDYPVAVVYTDDREKYNEEAKKWTQEYATDAETPNEELVRVDSRRLGQIEKMLKKYDLQSVMKRLSMNIWDEKRLEELLSGKDEQHQCIAVLFV